MYFSGKETKQARRNEKKFWGEEATNFEILSTTVAG